MDKPTVEQIVAAGQCLLPLDPPPTREDIVRVVAKIAVAFEVREKQLEACELWNRRVERLR